MKTDEDNDRSNLGGWAAMTGDGELATARLVESLRSSVNPDGGWGYSTGKASRLEPTTWAILALLDAETAETHDECVLSAMTLLAAWQNKDGLLSDISGAPPNFGFNGLAAVTIWRVVSGRHQLPEGRRPVLSTLLSAIQAGTGLRFPRSWASRQDNGLIAWPWHDGTSSWVEPTAWCTLALKRAPQTPVRPETTARIIEAERMLTDRCCLSGGWNSGNSDMLGKELMPYVPVTGLALLALQDRRALPETVRSRAWLAANWNREPSALAMSLAMIALNVYREPTDELERALVAHLAMAGPPDNLAARAITLYALSGRRHGWAAFTL